MKKSVVLLSGGLDSTTVLYYAKYKDKTDPYPISFRYGQKHLFELEAAEKTLEHLKIPLKNWKIIDINNDFFKNTALVEKDISVPKGRDINEEIPVTYVPARNTIFLSYAIAYGEMLGTGDIYIGVNAIDYSGYPDCREEYIESFEKTANLATKVAVEGEVKFKIHTPLIKLKKSEIVKLGMELNVDYSLSHSCYDPDENGNPCGECDSCRLRIEGFHEAGFIDPLFNRYTSKKYFPENWK